MPAPPRIKYRQLQYFLAAAAELHFSKAAESLFVTQSTLSHQLAELETRLGTPLFDRGGNGVQLTQAGKVFLEYARSSIEAIEAGCTAIDELGGLHRGELRVGVTQSLVRCLMPLVLAEFRSRHPAVHLLVLDLTAPQIERQLSDGTLDLGITSFTPILQQPDTVVEPILEDRLLFVVRRDHRLARLREVRFADLDGVPMAMLTRDYSTRQLIEDCFREAGATLRVACETNTVDLLVRLTLASDVASILPERAIEKSKGARALPIVDPIPTRMSAFLWPANRYRTLAATTFAGLVRERFASGPRSP